MRTLIVEDQRMFRELLAKMCETHFRHQKVVAVGTGTGGADAMAKGQFDLLILDIDLPDRDGFSLADEAAKLPSPPRVLGMSGYCDEFMVHRVMNSSMHGFIDKTDQSVETLAEAIRTVCAGNYFFSDVVHRMRVALRKDPQAFPKLLTERECEMLALLGQGLTNEQAGERLDLSPTTVQWHRKQLMRKLDLHSTVDLVVYAVEKGFTRLGAARPQGTPPHQPPDKRG
jgi:DNA-binding NarL/FixJ family response regulator